MNETFDVIRQYNPITYSNLIRSNLSIVKIDTIVYQKTGQYLPLDVKKVFSLFNGTKETFIEEGLYKRISPGCLFFVNGYLSSIERSLALIEKHSKYLKKKDVIYFPVFLTGYEIFYCVKLQSETDIKDNNGLFEMLDSKEKLLIYDTFESFTQTIAECYMNKIYFIDAEGRFINDAYAEFKLTLKNNTNHYLNRLA